MTPAASKEFRQEFEPKQQHKGCFGFLKGRKIKKRELEEITFNPICRSPAMLDVSIIANRNKIGNE